MKKYTNKETKSQRSTSVLLKGHKYTNNLDIMEKEKDINNNTSNSKKGMHHRKRTSSYFLGSYIPDTNIILNDDKEKEKEKKNEENDIKNKLIFNIMNIDNSNSLNISFPSYDEGNNNSVIIKKDNDNENEKNNGINNNNDIIKEIAKCAENSTKSFITLKNSLKYIKDKDERTTPSYQLALQADKKTEKNNYITSSNIIEEEKSSMKESKSEYSYKKEIIEKEKDEINKKNILNEYFNNLNINDNNNRMSLALNEIILKNNKKEENRRKVLTKNKMTLLNTFFTMSKTLKLNEIKKNRIEKENNEIKNKDNDEFFNNNKKYVRKFIKKNLNYKRQNNQNNQSNNKNEPNNYNINHHIRALTDNEFINNNKEFQNNINNGTILNIQKQDDNINNKKIINKIPHLNNTKKKQNNNNNNKKESPSSNILTPNKILKTSNSNNKTYNLRSIKRRENLNNALSFIREKQRNQKKINTNLYINKYYTNNTCNNLQGNKKLTMTNIYSTSSLTNSNTNSNSNNSKSLSKSKEKRQIILIKSKPNKDEYIYKTYDDNLIIENNKDKIIICLKDKLIFHKMYEKIDALEKIKLIDDSTKNFFVILCENNFNLKDKYIFSGLFKYYKDKERFNKIYGNERCPNFISLKDIKDNNKYKIFEDSNNFNLLDKFKFTSNAMVLMKN